MREDEEEVYIPPELEDYDEIATELPSTVKEPEDEPWTMPGSEPVAVPTPAPTPMPVQTPAPEQTQATEVPTSQAYEPEFELENSALFVDKNDEWTAVSPEHVESALSEGYEPAMFYVNPNEVDAATGQPERIVVRKSQLENAKKDGLIPVFTWHQRQQVEKAKKELPTSGREAALRGAATMFSFGQTPTLAGSKAALLDYFKRRDLAKAKNAFKTGRDVYRLEESAAKEQFPAEYFGGEVAGFVGGLGVSAPASVASAAGRGALFGGLTSAAGGATYPTPGEEETPLLQRTLTGIGLGAGLGAGGQKLGQVIGQKMAPKLQEIANARAVKAAQPTSFKKFARNVDRLPGGEQRLGRDALRQGLVKGGDTVDDIAEKALALQDQAGKKIGNLLREMERSAENVGVGKFQLENIVKRIDDEVMAPLIEEPATRQLAQRIESGYLTNLRDDLKLNEPLSFSKLHQRRSKLDKNKAYNANGIDTDYHLELQKIRNIMEDELFKGTDALAAKGGEALKNDYVKAKRAYQVGKKMAEGALEKSQNFRANRSFSFTDYKTGGAGATVGGFAGGAVAGFPGAVIGGAAGAGISGLGNKWAREMGNPYIANIAQEFAQKFKGDPNAAQKVLKELARIGLIKFPEEE